jgi:hypothetical protein
MPILPENRRRPLQLRSPNIYRTARASLPFGILQEAGEPLPQCERVPAGLAKGARRQKQRTPRPRIPLLTNSATNCYTSAQLRRWGADSSVPAEALTKSSLRDNLLTVKEERTLVWERVHPIRPRTSPSGTEQQPSRTRTNAIKSDHFTGESARAA